MALTKREQKSAIRELMRGTQFTSPMNHDQAKQFIDPMAALGPDRGDFAFIGDGETIAQASSIMLVLHRRRDGRYDIYRAFNPEDHPERAPENHRAYEGLSIAEASVIVGGRIQLHHNPDLPRLMREARQQGEAEP